MSYLIWLLGFPALLPGLAYSIPCYTETKSSKAMYRRHGPIVVDQNQCALACSCASGVNTAFDNCTAFNPPIPPVECHAYSYDLDTRQCALLGGERPNVCAEPVTIYEMGKCASYPACGSITLDKAVFCDSEGYKCPSEYLPYFSWGGLWGDSYTRAFIGGQL